MVTRKDRRDREKEINYFFELIKTKRHFFRDLPNKLKMVRDHRSQSYITYGPEVILFTTLLKNMTGLTSMRSMTESFNRDECIENIRKFLQLDSLQELPHYDTINDFLSGMDVSEVEKLRTYMIKELLKKRCFEKYRIENKYWGVIVDGTGLHTFNTKHCDHCLRREYKNDDTGETKTIYMHHVLEAKLVVGNMVLSIGTEFIENESEDTPKQDCELNAFKRLSKKIKDTFKRLPICILGDSLYACESVFNICDQNNWKYLFRFKEGRIRSIASEFKAIRNIEQVNEKDDFFWSNSISYGERTVNLLENKIQMDNEESKSFLFITNIRITKGNAGRLVHVGRSRWKIENQGFNVQKNIRYDIKHVKSHDYTAMKNHYLLIQIADIIMQLYDNGIKVLKKFHKTIKEKSSDLLEAIRTRRLTDEDLKKLEKPIQIRFT